MFAAGAEMRRLLQRGAVRTVGLTASFGLVLPFAAGLGLVAVLGQSSPDPRRTRHRLTARLGPPRVGAARSSVRRHVSIRGINVRYSERMDFERPVEALIPGASGRLLGALARVEAELPVSTLAAVAGVGRTRASSVLAALSDLGVVSRRQVGPTVLVRLERENAAGKLVADLANLRDLVVRQLRELAARIDPAPLSLTLFGSFARGEADRASDIDILAVPPSDDGRAGWAASLTDFSSRAQVLTGNAVQILDYDLAELKRRYATREHEAGAQFWRSATEDAVLLTGAELAVLIDDDHAAR